MVLITGCGAIAPQPFFVSAGAPDSLCGSPQTDKAREVVKEFIAQQLKLDH